LLRELRTHEQRVLSIRALIARELRENAKVVEVSERKAAYVYEIAHKIQTERWTRHAAEWSALRRKNVELWAEIADAYEALTRAKTEFSAPPASSSLRDLADRLDAAQI
jgi:hypothetical protein